MKPIRFSQHARQQMVMRGASRNEVIDTIRTGGKAPAKRGRWKFRKNFPYNNLWGGRRYAIKQVLAVVAEDSHVLVVVTVYTFYF